MSFSSPSPRSSPGPSPRGLVVVGASAGGVEALSTVVADLPPDLPAAVLVTVHVPSTGSALPAILDRRCPLPVRHAQEGDRLVAGEVLVAPPDHHLVVVGDRVSLTRGPQENGHRPAVDVMFRSAARAWGARVLGVVLSGALDDGAAGVVAVTREGGRCLLQSDPLFDGMVSAAARADDPEGSVPAAEIATTLVGWLAELPAPEGAAAGADHDGHPTRDDEEFAMAELDPTTLHRHDRPGDPSGFGCPDCAGALFRIEDERLVRFRCRVGHAWSPESLLVRQTVALESALWMALRSLEEKATLNHDLQADAAARGHDRAAARFGVGAAEALHAAELVRQLVVEVGESGARTAPGPDGAAPLGATHTTTGSGSGPVADGGADG